MAQVGVSFVRAIWKISIIYLFAVPFLFVFSNTLRINTSALFQILARFILFWTFGFHLQQDLLFSDIFPCLSSGQFGFFGITAYLKIRNHPFQP